MAAATGAQAQTDGEIGHPRQSLGYHAPVAEGFHHAQVQIETSRGVAVDDPVRLLNLGAVHMQSGRTETARRLFKAVRDHSRDILAEMANGEAISSREVARRALGRLNMAVASH